MTMGGSITGTPTQGRPCRACGIWLADAGGGHAAPKWKGFIAPIYQNACLWDYGLWGCPCVGILPDASGAWSADDERDGDKKNRPDRPG